MNYFTPLVAGVLSLAVQGSAFAVPIKFTTGDAKKGTLRFDLIAPDGTQLPVSITLNANTSAVDKAAAIENAVDGVAGWRANRAPGSNTVTFQHQEGGRFVDVTLLRDINDTTAEKEVIGCSFCPGGRFDFGIDNTFLALGQDADGGQSFVTVETSFGSASLPIVPGGSAESLIGSLFSALVATGAGPVLTSPTSFRFWDLGPDPFIAYQITDLQLPVRGAAGAVVPEPGTLSFMGAGLAGLAIRWKRRRAGELRC